MDQECAINMPHNNGRQKGKDKVADAGDTSRQSVEFEKSSSEICQATSLNSGTSQGDLGQIHGDQVPSPSAPFFWGARCPRFGRDDYRARCGPLLQAIIKGDWPAAKAFLDHEDPNCVRAHITKEEGTALHAAVTAQRTSFIKELLKLMESDDLKLPNKYGYTALHCAAQSGIVKIAEQLVKANKEPLMIPDKKKDVPLNVAAYLGHAKMVSYLFPMTDLEQLTPANRIELFYYTIYNELFDTGLEILKKYPHMATADSESCRGALEMLAKKPFAIGSESQLSFWKSLLKYSCFKGIYNKALMKTLAHKLVEDLWKMDDISDKQLSSNLVHFHITLLFEAAKVGNVEFLIILARSYPDLLWQQDENKMSIFHIAIKNRHENVLNLIFEIGANKDSLASYATLDTEDNMLHLAGELAPSHRLNIVSGAALQMQRELLWFKEIEKIVPWTFVTDKNSKKKTPKETFTDAHKDLQKDGEKWMKDTANYCMLVATLITTVIFAATFTVPGGSDQVTGIPIRLRSKGLMVYFISIAIALCSSSTSIVFFLSILTSTYTEDDFLKSLPLKLVLGLSTLFISMAGMMVAFCATCFLVYTSKNAWVIILVSIPITLFALLHCKIWVDALRSICNSRFIFRQYKYRLF